MKTMVKILVVVLIVCLPLVFWSDIKGAFASSTQEEVNNNKDKKKKKKGDKKEKEAPVSADVKVVKRWELPAVLTEVSGIEYLGANRFACIQDEQGTIYIYNTASGKIEKQVPFAGAGDFEGIAVAGNTAYAVQSDGKIYEVTNFQSGKPSVKSYATSLTAKQDVEGLTYDGKNNRLLLAIKGAEPGSSNYKGIYAFSLQSKQLATDPVYRIELTDPVFEGIREKKAANVMQPSEIEIHPTTGDIYVSEGASPKLLIMDANGKKRKLYTLSSADFPQAEGLAFSPAGELFVSNEGGTGKGTIVQVAINSGK
jgi:uncharacterized protein YjiK